MNTGKSDVLLNTVSNCRNFGLITIVWSKTE